jgi:hypothetical protein
MVAQFQSTITTEIVSSYYSDFDGTTYDTIKMVFPDGTVELRTGWTEEDFTTGEVTYYIRTKSGAVLNSNWKTTRNNKWLVSYKSIKLTAKQAQITTHNTALEVLASPELFDRAEYEQAKADLGF